MSDRRLRTATLFSSDDEDDGDQVPPTSIHPNERYIDDNCDNDNEYDNETEFDDDIYGNDSDFNDDTNNSVMERDRISEGAAAREGKEEGEEAEKDESENEKENEEEEESEAEVEGVDGDTIKLMVDMLKRGEIKVPASVIRAKAKQKVL